LGAVVQTLKDTGSVLGFVMFRGRFMFRLRGPWRTANVRREERGKVPRKRRNDVRLNPNDSLG